MLKIVCCNGKDEYTFLDEAKKRAGEVGEGIEAAARAIINDIKLGGYEAAEAYSLKFDGKKPYELTKDEIESAYARCPSSLIAALERAAENIRAYQSKLLVSSTEWDAGNGAKLGCIVRGIERLGIYVPGGTAAYPSSVLMSAIPARVAGVGEIIMVTPPTDFLRDEVLAAAKIAGVDRVIAIGGVQAVASLTYGAGFIPRVDKLVGPGNAYVAAAKRLAFGQIDIDMVAGPSEVLVIADETADPAYVAADLLSQAEHDVLASAVLLTDSLALAEAVGKEIAAQAEALSRKDIVTESLKHFGGALVCDNLDRAVELANEIVPEHLEIMTKAPRDLLSKVKNAGAVFLGQWSPEPLGDYMAGPSHVLPTSGTARFFSPLSVDSFLKKMSVIEYSRQALDEVSDGIIDIALCEGLDGHANSILKRKRGGGNE